MNNIKTVADFKRAMVPGTVWECIHKYLGDYPSLPKSLGSRKCVLNNSVGFAFYNESHGGQSHCSWPKKAEFSTEDNGNIVIITITNLCQLRYKEIA